MSDRDIETRRDSFLEGQHQSEGDVKEMEWTPVHVTETCRIIFDERKVDPGPDNMWKGIFFGVDGVVSSDGDGEYTWDIICSRPAPYPAVATGVTVAKGTASSLDDAQGATEAAFAVFQEKRKTQCGLVCWECELNVTKDV